MSERSLSSALELTRSPASVLRNFIIAVISFLTLVDLFATQAILPSLASAYRVAPAVIGSAVNICTLGMTVAGLAIAWFSRGIDRRRGVSTCLALLAIPTALLAFMPDLATFTALRLVQGVFMSAAFTLTMAYLSETLSGDEAAGALAAYVTGNVASNLFGRLMSAGFADHFGLSANFAIFAALNLLGAVIAYLALCKMPPRATARVAPDAGAWLSIFSRSELCAGFAIGFLILFTFIGTFTYVNFVLTGAAVGLTPMQLGFVYLVFVPSILATPFAGRAAGYIGTRLTVMTSLLVAAAGLPLLLSGQLPPILAGLTLLAAGTFFAQAAAVGYVSRAAGAQRGAASGIYLASYYGGGVAGSIALGMIFDDLGWAATVAVIGIALVLGIAVAMKLSEPATVR